MKRKFLVTLSSVGVLATTALLGCSGGKKVTYESNSEALGIEVEAMEKSVLGAYDTKYQRAAAITDGTKTKERYEAFAEAEYSLIYEEGIINPWLAQNGVSASVARTIARQAGKASYGLTADKFKNVVVTNSSITKTQRAAIDEFYETDKKPQDRTPDAQGWIKLDNANENKAIVDGKYTYAGIEFPTKNVFNTTYTKEPDKAFLNYLSNSWTYNSYHYCNMVDGLVENDKYGNIIGALADKYKVVDNEDGSQTWTFHLREGATWVNNATGAKVADVVPDDFVASLEWVLDATNASNTANIVYGFVSGAKKYYDATAKHAKDPSSPVPAFADTVKVAANATENTISYTLDEPTPYFISGLTYSPFLPVNRAFLAEQGADFGKSENNLLVNGAFRITEHVSSDHMKYEKNTSYYDAAHVYVDTVNRKFIPGTATSADVRGYYETNLIDSFTVNAKDTEGWKKYITGPEGTGTQKNPYSPECNPITSYGTATYIGYFNFNRSFWEYTNKDNAKNNAEALATAKALLNKNFRLGFVYGLNVLERLKLYEPDEPYNWLMRGYTNRELVSYEGKDYADFVDDVYNRANGLNGENKVSLTGILNGSDPIYNANKAKALFAQAKAELLAAGLTEKDFPIKIDVIGDMDVETQAYDQAMYDSINANGAGVIQISVNVPETDDQDTDWGSISNNYDYSMWSGWGPDYADPNTFGHTMCIGGDMVEQFGF